MLPADCSPLLCVDSLFLTVNAELMLCCLIWKKKLSLFFFLMKMGLLGVQPTAGSAQSQQSQIHLPIYSSSKFYKWSAHAKANLIRFKVPQEFSSYLYIFQKHAVLTFNSDLVNQISA